MKNQTYFYRLVSDIRFWLIFFFVIRLFGIMNPPLEFGHSWRQALTNMIARNFSEHGPDILHPMIDMAGNKTGIIGSEFPFFNYLIYLVSSVFDYSHWYGRLINLAVSTLGIYYFYKLIKGVLKEKVALYSALVLLVSIWFGYSRKTMPDTFSVALVIIGLYYAYDYLINGRTIKILLFFVFSTLGMLCKIPALSLFSILFLVPFIQHIEFRRRLIISLVAITSFGIVCLWYFYWVPHLLETYQYKLYFPKGLMEGLSEISAHIPLLLEQFYFNATFSFVSFGACLVGVYCLVRSDHTFVKYGILIVTLVFGLFIIKTGAVFPTHSYYIIPFVPVMALCAGYFLAKIPTKWSVALMLLISVESIGNQQHDFFIKDSEEFKLTLEDRMDEFVPKGDLILINGGSSPQHIYFSNRKGWTLNTSEISWSCVDSIAKLGGEFMVLDLTQGDLIYPQYTEVYADEFYKIYDLKGNGH